ncbi:thiamine biosynthesis protein ApbE [Marinitoga sp. 1135]|uniref:FAD:protein FMN transferase n=1 Tax=Marinitoga piezophila (strain DSM 14283 / JCM 11233 / KA3) TaxID=443254 RepID=H2J3A5_MARPK|nr:MULTISPECIES: FAD:protein FMN transferase [Marinitoga]AEX85721.1 membrane-associated lipoprotein involved in thiamine biosynthesis [Marinitoga piezophila KA3]APT76173.1 thiamine biosynthesis protein ApbE [Marinitoga sp. 1137]NUU95929.1 thiamine biosynthesis protein ApbE [Marinitoga sp. 1135]NUU97840.1 thiamine biosynthesis protein ApbE [Marinitoga sp. 1138]
MLKKNPYNFLKNKGILYSVIAGIAIILTLFLIFHKPLPQYYSKKDFALGTWVNVKVAGNKINSEKLADIAFDEMKRIERKFSKNIKGSVIWELNEKRSIIADKETLFLMKAAINYADLTGGAFDPAIGALVKLWGFDDMNSPKRVPSKDEINNALKGISYKFIKIEGNKISLLNDETMIDLGGIAKGYAVDMAINKIKSLDPKATGFIDAGGDIGIIGPKFNRFPWVIGIRDPDGNPYDIKLQIYLKEGAIVTSGNYERYFEKDGVRYHHLIDPKTGYPANFYKSVSIISDSAMKADAMSTAIFILGDKLPDIDSMMQYDIQIYGITSDNKIIKTTGFDYYLKK